MRCAASMAHARPGSTYLQMCRTRPELIANRGVMLEHYCADMHRLAQTSPPPPLGCPAGVRLVTWNINCLRGPTGNSIVAPADVAGVLQSLDADVVALQEAPIDADDEVWGQWLVEPVKRLRELDALLQGLGYTLLRSPATNPTLVATRLPVQYSEALLLDAQPIRSLNGPNSDQVWSESRGAQYVELALPTAQRIGVYATHLHHKDAELCRETGATIGGVRGRQTGALLRHWEARASASDTIATFVLADLNQPLRRHHDDAEWRVVSAGLRHPAVAQPEADGVEEQLRAKGFASAYDAAEGRDNFGGRPAPALTHWTGTAVDFVYVNAPAAVWGVAGAYVRYCDLSDHAPVVVDFSPVPSGGDDV